MKKNLLLFLTMNFVWLNFIVSQQYTPLQFKNYIPLWTHLHNTDKIPIKSGNLIFLEQNFYRAPAVIDKNVLYNVYNIVFGPAWIGGYYIEAIDVTNGMLLWDQVYYSETVGERRYANRPIVKGDTLELFLIQHFLFQKIPMPEEFLFPFPMALHIFIIMIQTSLSLIT